MLRPYQNRMPHPYQNRMPHPDQNPMPPCQNRESQRDPTIHPYRSSSIHR